MFYSQRSNRRFYSTTRIFSSVLFPGFNRTFCSQRSNRMFQSQGSDRTFYSQGSNRTFYSCYEYYLIERSILNRIFHILMDRIEGSSLRDRMECSSLRNRIECSRPMHRQLDSGIYHGCIENILSRILSYVLSRIFSHESYRIFNRTFYSESNIPHSQDRIDVPF
jgi:hypothetical protein